MSCWEVLGIEPTSDLRALKRAYAKKLKRHKPDQDPEGFKQLRSAYEQAQYEAQDLAVEVQEQEVECLQSEPSLSENTTSLQYSSDALNTEEPTPLSQAPNLLTEFDNDKVLKDEHGDPIIFGGHDGEAAYIKDENGQVQQLVHASLDDICQYIIENINQAIEDKAECLGVQNSELIQDLDLQNKRDMSFRIFHHLAELVMSTDPSTPKPTDAHFISIAQQLEAEFHWNIDPLIEQYFSPEQINRVLPQYFELRLAEVDKQKLFQPSGEKASLVLPYQPVGMLRSIARWFVDLLIVLVSLELINIGLAKVFTFDLFAFLESTPAAFPELIVIVLTLFFYGVVSNIFGAKGTIGARVFGLVIARVDGSKPELYQVLLNYTSLLPWLVFTVSGKFVFLSLSLSLLMEHWLGLKHIYRKDANWLAK